MFRPIVNNLSTDIYFSGHFIKLGAGSRRSDFKAGMRPVEAADRNFKGCAEREKK
jgi:hypothetical protein